MNQIKDKMSFKRQSKETVLGLHFTENQKINISDSSLYKIIVYLTSKT